MVYLTAAVVLLGTVAVLNLVLTVGVVRRLREHAAKLAGSAGGPDLSEIMIEVGARVGDFTATTTGGLPVSRDELLGHTMVGFFTPHCPPCRTAVPAFVEVAAGLPGRGEQALAVVVGEAGPAQAFAGEFPDWVRVVIEPDSPHLGPVAAGFSVVAFPSFGLVDRGGVLLAAAHTPRELPTPVPA